MEHVLNFVQNLVREISRAELLPRFGDTDRHTKRDGSIVTEADLVMQDRLRDALQRYRPDIGFFGEEMAEDEHRQLLAGGVEPLWCLDPLDGTSNFANGLPFFSVSLALLINGSAALGVVYDPLRDECFSALRGAGAWLNGDPVQVQPRPPSLARCIAAVDFKRLEKRLAATLASRPPYASQRNIGSSALEWCWLAHGRFQLYLHGGQKIWDYAAGNLVLAEAGGQAATLEGESVLAMTAAPRSVVAGADAGLFRLWSEWLADVR